MTSSRCIPKIQFQLAIYIVNIMLCEGDGVIQHVLKLGKHVGDLSDNHGESGRSTIRPGGDVCAVGQQHVGAVGILVQGSNVKRGVTKSAEKKRNRISVSTPRKKPS